MSLYVCMYSMALLAERFLEYSRSNTRAPFASKIVREKARSIFASVCFQKRKARKEVAE